ncbi:MAG: PSD1 and planctomycete cytochrome C domain-containing protein [Bryobacteraceae bacterium]
MRWTLRLAMLLAVAAVTLAAADTPDFARDIAPVFSKRCLFCHGTSRPMAGLRLDSEAAVRKGGNLGAVIVPGASGDSPLIQRISSDDSAFRMPPQGAPVPEEDIARIRSWIDALPKAPEKSAAVAPPSRHWSFQPIRKPAVPPGYPSAIDAFVRERLKTAKLAASEAADPVTLARRLTLDLTGLPPTPSEIDAYVADRSPAAYEKLIDRLLASPRYGERWARPWLDLAHYADSDGYEKDLARPWAWRWRQWVIEALNRDLPFDQFTIWQLAGDLLPNPTQDQRIATGFLRNTLTNREAGVDRAEARFEQIINRANTVSTTWLGLTAGCAQCHNHKFDPISQREYYSLFAFFDAADEEDIDAPFPSEEAPYRAARVEYERKRAEILKQYKIADYMGPWWTKLHGAFEHQGADTEWDFQVTEFRAGFTGAELFLKDHPRSKPPREQDRLVDFFVGHIGPDYDRDKAVAASLKQARDALRKLQSELPPYTQAPVMLAEPAVTHLRLGGDYKTMGEAVEPGTLAILPPLKAARPTRLDLARWITAAENPLTARVAANRIWQELFGRGLVQTSEDFGTQGDKPSHPELLDWLATEFAANGWSQKALIKSIVLSDTYRQSSRLRPDLAAKDPENILLARQSRLRLPAELIRDETLFASGLLYEQIGGRSVRPPQPKGVAELGYASSLKWVESPAPERYRRGLYVHYQRTTPYPMLSNFDVPDSNISCSRRRASNTPLQALNLLNDPVFFEAAQALTKRVESEKDPVGTAFRLTLARAPDPTEREQLAKLPLVEVARVLLNLDEFLTRE